MGKRTTAIISFLPRICYPPSTEYHQYYYRADLKTNKLRPNCITSGTWYCYVRHPVQRFIIPTFISTLMYYQNTFKVSFTLSTKFYLHFMAHRTCIMYLFPHTPTLNENHAPPRGHPQTDSHLRLISMLQIKQIWASHLS